MAEGEHVLFACTRCYTRHRFEELSPDRHLCKKCQEIYEPPEYVSFAKCAYCRSEFQQTRKDAQICEKCEQNLIKFGQPSICECCSLLAAFIGKKCQRCHNSEKKYGPPVYCQQCKLKCAFERDDDKKIEGMQLCWLCTLAYKRAIAKAKPSDQRYYVKQRPERVDVTQYQVSPPPVVKQLKLSDDRTLPLSVNGVCSNCSKHLLTVTQLREEIASLQRQLNQKDKEIVQRDMKLTEREAVYRKNQEELREQMNQNKKEYDSQLEALQTKLKQMQKEIASLSKLKHKSSSANKKYIHEDIPEDSPEKR